MSDRFCTFPGCGLTLKTHDAKRLGLCWTHRGPQANKEWASVEAPVSGTEGADVIRGEVTVLASAKARHPAGKGGDGGPRSGVMTRGQASFKRPGEAGAPLFPCFFHSRPDKWSCPECIEIGEAMNDARGF